MEDSFIDKLIAILVKKTTITNVLSIPRDGYNDLKFKTEVDNQNRYIVDYRNDLENYIYYFKGHFPDAYKQSPEYEDFVAILDQAPVGKFHDATLYQLAYCKILLLLYVVQGYIEVEYSEIDSPQSTSVYYRGQSDYSYKLLPSYYRDLKSSGIISYNTLNEHYKTTPFFEKYKDHIDKITDIDYSFLSFIQHAVCYSPFLDFSESKDIATVFATCADGKNYNTYTQTDASVYAFYPHNSIVTQTNIDDLLQNHNVQFYSGRIKYDSTIFGKPLLCCDIHDFDVELFSITSPTNDRMRYQKGVFLYFQKCVIVNKELFFPYSIGYITKSRIQCKKNLSKSYSFSKSKEELYKEIVSKNPEIDLEHLMNPYNAFIDYSR